MAGSHPLGHGDSGAAVVALQSSLAALGYHSTDAHGEFGDRTVAVVEAFQRSKGLPITGVVDDLTRQRIEEASWRLGSRLLFLSRPHLRGDDVAALQIQLAQLGFNPGRVDGIFGVNTESALRDFQKNCGLAVDGTLTRATLTELDRLRPRDGRQPVTEAREVAGLDTHMGPIVVTGDAHMGAALSARLRESFEVVEHYDEPTRVAVDANFRGASLVISVNSGEGGPAVHLAYWAGFRTHSRSGEQLAAAIATRFASNPNSPRVDVAGMALPLLRETRMTSLRIESVNLSDQEFLLLADVISSIVSDFMHSRLHY